MRKLNQDEHKDLLTRIQTWTVAHNQAELIKESNDQWLRAMARKYRIKGKFTINPDTGEFIVLQVIKPEEQTG